MFGWREEGVSVHALNGNDRCLEEWDDEGEGGRGEEGRQREGGERNSDRETGGNND